MRLNKKGGQRGRGSEVSKRMLARKGNEDAARKRILAKAQQRKLNLGIARTGVLRHDIDPKLVTEQNLAEVQKVLNMSKNSCVARFVLKKELKKVLNIQPEPVEQAEPKPKPKISTAQMKLRRERDEVLSGGINLPAPEISQVMHSPYRLKKAQTLVERFGLDRKAVTENNYLPISEFQEKLNQQENKPSDEEIKNTLEALIRGEQVSDTEAPGTPSEEFYKNLENEYGIGREKINSLLSRLSKSQVDFFFEQANDKQRKDALDYAATLPELPKNPTILTPEEIAQAKEYGILGNYENMAESEEKLILARDIQMAIKAREKNAITKVESKKSFEKEDQLPSDQTQIRMTNYESIRQATLRRDMPYIQERIEKILENTQEDQNLIRKELSDMLSAKFSPEEIKLLFGETPENLEPGNFEAQLDAAVARETEKPSQEQRIYISVRDALNGLDISQEGLKELIRNKEIKYTEMDGQIVLDVDDIKRIFTEKIREQFRTYEVPEEKIAQITQDNAKNIQEEFRRQSQDDPNRVPGEQYSLAAQKANAVIAINRYIPISGEGKKAFVSEEEQVPDRPGANIAPEGSDIAQSQDSSTRTNLLKARQAAIDIGDKDLARKYDDQIKAQELVEKIERSKAERYALELKSSLFEALIEGDVLPYLSPELAAAVKTHQNSIGVLAGIIDTEQVQNVNKEVYAAMYDKFLEEDGSQYFPKNGLSEAFENYQRSIELDAKIADAKKSNDYKLAKKLEQTREDEKLGLSRAEGKLKEEIGKLQLKFAGETTLTDLLADNLKKLAKEPVPQYNKPEELSQAEIDSLLDRAAERARRARAVEYKPEEAKQSPSGMPQKEVDELLNRAAERAAEPSYLKHLKRARELLGE